MSRNKFICCCERAFQVLLVLTWDTMVRLQILKGQPQPQWFTYSVLRTNCKSVCQASFELYLHFWHSKPVCVCVQSCIVHEQLNPFKQIIKVYWLLDPCSILITNLQICAHFLPQMMRQMMNRRFYTCPSVANSTSRWQHWKALEMNSGTDDYHQYLNQHKYQFNSIYCWNEHKIPNTKFPVS